LIAALFVPGDRPERFEKAIASGADVAILDLEDAVGFERKEFARDAVARALSGGIDAWVRINPPAGEFGRLDLVRLSGLRPRRVMLPKAADAGDVALVRKAFPDVPVVALIESIDGLRHIDAIAAAPGLAALAFGAFDLCAEAGARPIPEVLAPWRSAIIVAARAAGIAAIDTPYLALDDEAGLAADSRRAVDFGFDAKLAIHPKQIAAIRAAFVPSPEELARAHRILEAARAGGVSVIDGAMIDGPIFAAARRVVARAGEKE